MKVSIFSLLIVLSSAIIASSDEPKTAKEELLELEDAFDAEVKSLQSPEEFPEEGFNRIRDKRVINGMDAKIEDFPFLVNIRYHCKFWEFLSISGCGGSILSPTIILTAAHCIPTGRLVCALSTIKVRAGSNLTYEGGSTHKVVAFRVHPDYNASAFLNDIGLLKVDPPINLDRRTRDSITMIESNVPPASAGVEAVTAGWGSLNCEQSIFRYQAPKRLQSLRVKVWSREWCDFKYDKTGGMRSGTICASRNPVESDASVGFGDSGGPLVVAGKLAGVTSTTTCGAKPDVFAEVAYYIEWIQDAKKSLNG